MNKKRGKSTKTYEIQKNNKKEAYSNKYPHQKAERYKIKISCCV
jgi:hypothetical protein